VIEQAARDAGLTYVAIPVGHGGFSQGQVEAMAETLAGARPDPGLLPLGHAFDPALGAGPRQQGATAEELAPIANAAGYDITPVRPLVDMLSGKGTADSKARSATAGLCAESKSAEEPEAARSRARPPRGYHHRVTGRGSGLVLRKKRGPERLAPAL
jgi:hypothetical protein